MNDASLRKRAELLTFIEHEVVSEPSIQGIVAIGSVAKGYAREDSDIDVVVFLNPLDLYAIPAEFKWNSETRTFHGIFSTVERPVQIDCKRIDLALWSQDGYEWPESMRAELGEGWVAFDRHNKVRALVEQRTAYDEQTRQTRLDGALVYLDWLLSPTTTDRTWETLGPIVAHHRLHSAFDYLVQGLFAYHSRWRTLPSREMSDLIVLPWLPERLNGDGLLVAMNALSGTEAGYQVRVDVLRGAFEQLLTACQERGLYGAGALDEAFTRLNDEPGRDWNMDEWNEKHQAAR